jgi:hypothetical protein
MLRNRIQTVDCSTGSQASRLTKKIGTTMLVLILALCLSIGLFLTSPLMSSSHQNTAYASSSWKKTSTWNCTCYAPLHGYSISGHLIGEMGFKVVFEYNKKSAKVYKASDWFSSSYEAGVPGINTCYWFNKSFKKYTKNGTAYIKIKASYCTYYGTTISRSVGLKCTKKGVISNF